MRIRHFIVPALISTSSAAAAAPAPAPAPAPQTIARTAITAELGTTFKSVDTNGDGMLSQAEIAATEARMLQKRVAEVHARLEAEFTRADTNKDGQLSKAEFFAAGPQPPASPPNGAGVIAKLDANKDGKVSLAEFSAERLSAFDALDTNHDGVLSVAERQAGAKR